jgi:hypothetical protein
MLLRNLHARHCLADGSNELQCPQRKNVGTAVAIEPFRFFDCAYYMHISTQIRLEATAGKKRCPFLFVYYMHRQK